MDVSKDHFINVNVKMVSMYFLRKKTPNKLLYCTNRSKDFDSELLQYSRNVTEAFQLPAIKEVWIYGSSEYTVKNSMDWFFGSYLSW